jgi:uncharacterized membrane protein YcaP (DUF421 family)
VDIDLAKILLPDTPPLEIFIRGTLTYLALFLLLRVTRNRSGGTLGMADLLILVLIADAAQNAMAGSYASWMDGFLLVLTIVGWAYALDWLAYRFPSTVGRFMHPLPKDLVRDGKTVQRTLDQELIGHEELMTQLRLQGIEHIEEVERASMEGNGSVSVVKRDSGEPADDDGAGSRPRRSAAG